MRSVAFMCTVYNLVYPMMLFNSGMQMLYSIKQLYNKERVHSIWIINMPPFVLNWRRGL